MSESNDSSIPPRLPVDKTRSKNERRPSPLNPAAASSANSLGQRPEATTLLPGIRASDSPGSASSQSPLQPQTTSPNQPPSNINIPNVSMLGQDHNHNQSPYASSQPMLVPLADSSDTSNGSTGNIPIRKRNLQAIPSSLRRLSRSFSDNDAIESVGNASSAIGSAPMYSQQQQPGALPPSGFGPPSVKPIAVPSHLPLRKLSRSSASDSDGSEMGIPTSPNTLSSPPNANLRVAGQRRRASILTESGWSSAARSEASPQFGSTTPQRHSYYMPNPEETEELFKRWGTSPVPMTPWMEKSAIPSLIGPSASLRYEHPTPAEPRHLYFLSTSAPDVRWSQPREARSPSPTSQHRVSLGLSSPATSKVTKKRTSVTPVQRPSTDRRPGNSLALLTSPVNPNPSSLPPSSLPNNLADSRARRMRTASAVPDATFSPRPKSSNVAAVPTMESMQTQYSMSHTDYQIFTGLVEKARQAKNHRWAQLDMVAIWPSFHDGFDIPTSSIRPSPGNAHHSNSGSRPSSIFDSPVFQPTAMDFRSPSPFFQLDDDDEDEYDSERESSASSSISRGQSFTTKPDPKYTRPGRTNRPLHVTTGIGIGLENSPNVGMSPSISANTPFTSSTSGSNSQTSDSRPRELNRSLSDSNLDDFLKSYEQLRNQLNVVKGTCDAEVSRVIAELHEHVERQLQERFEAAAPGDLMTGSKRMSYTDSSRRTSDIHHMPLQHRMSVASTLSETSSSGTDSLPRNTQSTNVLSGNATAIAKDKADSVPQSPRSPRPPRAPSQQGRYSLASNRSVPESFGSVDEDAPPSLLEAAMSELTAVGQSILETDGSQLLELGACHNILNTLFTLQHQWTINQDWPFKGAVGRILLAFGTVVSLVEHLEEDERSWTAAVSSRVAAISAHHSNANSNNGSNRNGSNNNNNINSNNRSTGQEGSSLPSSQRQSVVDRVFERRASTASSLAGTDDEGSASGSISESGAEGTRSPPLRRGRRRRRTHVATAAGGIAAPVESGPGTPPLPTRPPRPPPSPLADPLRSQMQHDWSLTELRAAADEGQSLNVLMEIAPDGSILYISPIVSHVFGFDASELVGKHPAFLPENGPDALTFKEATDGLLATFIPQSSAASMPSSGQIGSEIRYRARIKDGRWVQMEGKGIAIYDRATGKARSTIWITRPVQLIGEGWEDIDTARASDEECSDDEDDGDISEDETDGDTEEDLNQSNELETTPSEGDRMVVTNNVGDEANEPSTSLATPPTEAAEPEIIVVCCNICERTIPAVLFEDHTAVCGDVHRTEQAIVLMNDELRETRRQVAERYENLKEQLDDLDDVARMYVGRLTLILRDILGILEEAILLPMPEDDGDDALHGNHRRSSSQRLSHMTASTISPLTPLPGSSPPSPSVILDAESDYATRARKLAQWRSPNEKEFYPPSGTSTPSASEPSSPHISTHGPPKNVDPELETLGMGALQLCLVVARLVNDKGSHCEIMKEALVRYIESAAKEEALRLGLENPISIDTVSPDTIPVGGGMKVVSSPASEPGSPPVNSILPDKQSPGTVETDVGPKLTRKKGNRALRDENATSADRPGRGRLDRKGVTDDKRSEGEPSATPLFGGPPISKFKHFFNSLWGRDKSRERRASVRATPPGSPRQSSLSRFDTSDAAKAVPLGKAQEFQSLADLAASKDGGVGGSDVSLTSHRPGDKLESQDSNSVNSISSPTSPVSITTPTIATAQLQRSTPSIKDFEIIKPISKGAFGSVYLAKRRLTGEYFAVKVLRKNDMVAKNQVTNIKAERMILTQLDSPYVVKLYFSFQTKENLYLVMEYLNGGDCAALIKAVGQLDEKWAKGYIAELVLALEYLHDRGIIHRDLKPDNLLIDHNGHIKLTDFGLSRAGFRGRTAPGVWEKPSQSASPSSQSATSPIAIGGLPALLDKPPHTPTNLTSNPWTAAAALSPPSFLTSPSSHLRTHSRRSSIASTMSTLSTDGVTLPPTTPPFLAATSVPASLIPTLTPSNAPTIAPTIPPIEEVPSEKLFVGTPDYIAPESIADIGQASVDWWAVGVILYEFLYGFPPFHAETPSKVFENILSRNIDWHEDEIDISPEARDLMEKLLCTDFNQRFGTRGGAREVKNHPFFSDIHWDELASVEPSFVPKVKDEEDTEYFDTRGARKSFPDEEENDAPISPTESQKGGIPTENPSCLNTPTASVPTSPTTQQTPIWNNPSGSNAGTPSRRNSKPDSPPNADFGEFVYKNLPLLERANAVIVKKLQSGLAAGSSSSLSTDRAKEARSRNSTVASGAPWSESGRGTLASLAGLPAPIAVPHNSGSSSGGGSYRERQSSVSSNEATTPTLMVEPTSPTNDGGLMFPESFRPRQKLLDEHTMARRNSLPSRLRTLSGPSNAAATGSTTVSLGSYSPEQHLQTAKQQLLLQQQARSRSGNRGHSRAQSRTDALLLARRDSVPEGARPMDILVVDDNPMICKILETMLVRLNCRVVVVRNGAEAIRCAMGDVKFDVIFMDIRMPIVDGETATRMIKSINNINQYTPIIAITAYEQTFSVVQLFDDVMPKPVSKDMVTRILRAVADAQSTQPQPPIVRSQVVHSSVYWKHYDEKQKSSMLFSKPISTTITDNSPNQPTSNANIPNVSLVGQDHHNNNQSRCASSQPMLVPLADSSDTSNGSTGNMPIRKPAALSPPAFVTSPSSHLRTHFRQPSIASAMSMSSSKFAETPDYVAPEIINDVVDPASDWSALGVILYEFLYGFTPFDGDTVEELFKSIETGMIDWPEDETDVSSDARDLMEKLLCTEFKQRLGSRGGAQEVKYHPFFSDVHWDELASVEPSFVPKLKDDESTDCFDGRGAEPMSEDKSSETPKVTSAEYHHATTEHPSSLNTSTASLPPSPTTQRTPLCNDPSGSNSGTPSRRGSKTDSPPKADFGEFVYKNLDPLGTC
ncbi:hypothetical protein SmJEL517_g01853 [Synchytrium microbalum]|uniref:non-specific serine/threonine protein kinase n=1 Tax=Synchytrium microbalum TaxID=1806994 RepID=A0A507C9Z2_9FUNG|nr:uncharacterized protein SmJEL517_g01853 [Synchytrium microbalum]TPX35989.1 hypothetical protein SmJEL517_g01853 [Synchytrium microbalum]